MRKPSEQEIKGWLKNDTTKYVLDLLANKIVELDTVRNLDSNNHVDKLADKRAIEVLENIFIDVYKELPQLQQKVAKEQFSIIRSLYEFKDTDY
jgi:transcription initiation factor TFIIIB Brf1 subunit/transcription initiation factor TFIIB